LLNNALQQTGWTGSRITERNWRKVVRDRVAEVDWSTALPDVQPFLDMGAQHEVLTRVVVKFDW
jgi:hypothetical protein